VLLFLVHSICAQLKYRVRARDARGTSNTSISSTIYPHQYGFVYAAAEKDEKVFIIIESRAFVK
jgi:hypothetical protein